VGATHEAASEHDCPQSFADLSIVIQLLFSRKGQIRMAVSVSTSCESKFGLASMSLKALFFSLQAPLVPHCLPCHAHFSPVQLWVN
jgi:hypothetical protein